MNEEIMVSICCITYNQEEYIKDAIESFLMQKTNFKYEIIIRDDASTDNTANIIKEYEKKYPDIIKPIYEKINGRELGTRRGMNITFEKAKGKYIAFCEGDDYWISDEKLQLQVDYMESHNGCSFCFHNANLLYMKSKRIKKQIVVEMPIKKFYSKDSNYTADAIHLVGMGGIPTASFMFRKKDAKDYPSWYFDAICGDLPLKLFMTSKGYAHYIDKILSVYRRETGKSVTDRWKEQQKNVEFSRKYIKDLIKILDDFNEYTNFKYDEGLKISKEIYNLEQLVLEKNFKRIIKSKEYRKFYKLKFRDPIGIKLFIKSYFGFIGKIKERIR